MLHKLAGEFEGASEALRDEVSRLQSGLKEARAESQAERRAAQEEWIRPSNALTELELLQHDDNAAAKMVSIHVSSLPFLPPPFLHHNVPRFPPSLSRKFSQNTTDTLQKALEAPAARHAATTSTLHTQLASAQGALATEQLARETYGRRREIALRLAVVGREDQLAEALRRWVRRVQETWGRMCRPRVNSMPSSATRARSWKAQTRRRRRLGRMWGPCWILGLDPGGGCWARAQVEEEGRVVPPVPPLSPSSAVKTSVTAEEAPPEVTKVDVATSPICPCPSPEPPPADPKTTSPPRTNGSNGQHSTPTYPKIYRRISGIFVAAFFAFVVACLDSSKFPFDSSQFAASIGYHFSMYY